MKQFGSILVCIDDFHRDSHVLRFVAKTAEMANAETVHLLYVPAKLWQPKADGARIAKMHPHDGISEERETDPADQARYLQELRDRCLGDTLPCEVKIHMVSGAPLYEILEYALSRNVDLLAMPRDFGALSEKGSKALFARRITRRATCSVLTVPENAEFKMKKILVPHRNSECSLHAFIEACVIAETTEGMVDALNIYPVNANYVYAGIPLSEHLSNLERYAHHETQMLLDRAVVGNIEIRLSFLPDFDAEPARIIMRHASENESDMIVIGARGRTGAAGVLLGTVTEQLIQHAPLPVLAVKKKGECIGFLKALLEVMGFER